MSLAATLTASRFPDCKAVNCNKNYFPEVAFLVQLFYHSSRNDLRTLFYVWASVCVHAHARVCVSVHLCTCNFSMLMQCKCRGQRKASWILLQHFHCDSLEPGSLSVNLEVCEWPDTPAILLSLTIPPLYPACSPCLCPPLTPQPPPIPPCPSTRLYRPMMAFYMGSGHTNSGPSAFTASILTHDPSPGAINHGHGNLKSMTFVFGLVRHY